MLRKSLHNIKVTPRWIVCVAALFIPATLLAQWPAVRSASAPRAADGRVDLLASAPRTPDGKPDLSGIWDKGLLPAEAPPPDLFSGIGPSQAFRDLQAAVSGELPMLPWADAIEGRPIRAEQQGSPRRALPPAASNSAAPASAAAKDPRASKIRRGSTSTARLPATGCG